MNAPLCKLCDMILEYLHTIMWWQIRVAVFFFVFPISRSAHLWAPDEVKKKIFFVKQSRRPSHFHPAQQKKNNDINIRPKIGHKRLS